MLPDHITAFVLLNASMILINDLAPDVQQRSFALEESTENEVCLVYGRISIRFLYRNATADSAYRSNSLLISSLIPEKIAASLSQS